jgi:hypothetical protein
MTLLLPVLLPSSLTTTAKRVTVAAGIAERTSHSQARRWLQNDVYEGTHIKPSHESVASFCARYLESRDKLAPSTLTRYEGYLAHVKRDLSAVALARFTGKVAITWKKKQLAGGLSPATVRKHLIFVGAAMTSAVTQHLIPVPGGSDGQANSA